MNNLSISSIASVAYRTSVTDRGFFQNFLQKNIRRIDYAKLQSQEIGIDGENEINTNTARRRIPEGTSHANKQSKQIWKDGQNYPDTINKYRRPYSHLGLRTRISSNSGGSLPLPTNFLSTKEIQSADSATITNYLASSGSIRKCCFTVLAKCSQMAIWSLGIFKNFEERTYSCKPIALSVHELSKSTNAGTDTMGQKNDPDVQRRVISQVSEVFKKPTSFKLFKNNEKLFSISMLKRLYDLPEVIFHRFQATYDRKTHSDVEKSRIVWCVPYTIVAIENIFFGNIIESTKMKALTSEEVIYPIGLTNYQIGQKSVRTLRDLFRRIENKRYKIYSLDFSKFDSTIPNWVKDLFFAVIEPLLDLNPNYKKVYDYLRLYIKYTPFVHGKNISYKRKGISSGLLITNLFDSYWNLTIHYFVQVLKEFFPEELDSIYDERVNSINDLKFDTSNVKLNFVYSEPWVRVMGDDSIILCDDFTLNLHRKVCELFGMRVTIKHVTNSPDEDIFFLGRYWNNRNRPFQTEHYMALRICYTKWYDEKRIPFELKDLHLYRMLSICLPLVGGKEFLDKYLFDYQPYKDFKESKKGFIYMKEFIEDNFQYHEYNKAFDVDAY